MEMAILKFTGTPSCLFFLLFVFIENKAEMRVHTKTNFIGSSESLLIVKRQRSSKFVDDRKTETTQQTILDNVPKG